MTLQLAKLDTPSARLAELNRHLSVSADSLRTAAQIFRVMVMEGDDTSSIPAHVTRMLGRINARLLLPEVVTVLQGLARARIGNLPINVQRELIKPDATVTYIRSADAPAEAISVRNLTPAQARQVIGATALRSEAEQRDYLRQAAGVVDAPPTLGAVAHVAGVEVDHVAGVAVIAGRTFSRKQLTLVLAAMKQRRPQRERDAETMEVLSRMDRGESLAQIARELGQNYPTLHKRVHDFRRRRSA